MKKLKIFLFILLLITILLINNNVKALLPLSGKLIVIDIGHGGLDPGTISGTTYEKDINLSIGKLLELELVKNGASVLLTRDGDYDLSSPNATYRKKSDFDNRIKLINDSKANMYLSLHLNYLPQTAYHGAQVFYNNETNQKIAEIFQKTLNKGLNENRQIKKIPNRTYMYDKLTIPGILIECGFLSNPEELAKLKTPSYQQKIATLLKDALIAYY